MYKGKIIVIYHFPSTLDGYFIKFLEDIVEELIIEEERMIIGNFTTDFMIDLFYTRKLQKDMQNLDIKQYVDKPMRIMKNSKTLIDLVLANKKVEWKVYDKPKIMDHSWISVELNFIDGERDKYRAFVSRDCSIIILI